MNCLARVTGIGSRSLKEKKVEDVIKELMVTITARINMGIELINVCGSRIFGILLPFLFFIFYLTNIKKRKYN